MLPKSPRGDKNNLNIRIRTEPVTAGEDATVYVWFYLPET